jgi:hypothetical protein
MSKSKVVSSGKMTPVRGGSGHMFGKQHAGPKKPGITGKAQTGDGGKFAKGGPTGKVGKQGTAGKAVAGRVSTGRGAAIGR